ncbi:MAG: sigma-70 family RNA polymerase sigma factor [Anaerolineae bacterium]
MTEDELRLWILWERCRRGDGEVREEVCKNTREKLAVWHLPLVDFWVRKMSSEMPWASREDLKQAGAIGLLEAIDRFDFKRGYKFSTYARYWIRAKIWDSPEVTRGIPRRQGQNLRKVRRAHDELIQELGRKPVPEEIAQKAELTLEQVEAALNAMAVGFPELHEDPEVRYDSADDWDTVLSVEAALQSLSEREREVLIRTYWEGLSGSEIGQILGLTPNNVKQIRHRAMKKLREWFEVQKGGKDHEA